MTYYEYYTFVQSRLKDYEDLDLLTYRIFDESFELLVELNKVNANDSIDSKYNLHLELGDVLFYFVALQTKYFDFAAYTELNTNDVIGNEMYDSYSQMQLFSYLSYYLGGLIGFIHDYYELRETNEFKQLLINAEFEGSEQVAVDAQNVFSGLNFYTTVLFELIATIAERFGSTFGEILELNVDKLVQRDTSGK